MPRRVRLALLLAVVAGCRADSSKAPQAPPPVQAAANQAGPVRQVAFQQVSTRPLSTSTSPTPSPEHSASPDELSLAADCLERGDDVAAVIHLKRHVDEHPEQVVFQAQLAEVLARLGRLREAQVHFEAAVVHAQDGPLAARRELVHYHTRLMEIARAREDAYLEHLHRGIGLYLVGCRISSKGDSGEAERLLCKAAAALKEAQAARPDDGRTAWYLHRIWSQLDQPRPASRALRKAIACAPFSRLTPAESRDLAISGSCQ
jgi:tetratricopeptide (TPR) repeat protein